MAGPYPTEYPSTFPRPSAPQPAPTTEQRLQQCLAALAWCVAHRDRALGDDFGQLEHVQRLIAGPQPVAAGWARIEAGREVV